MNYVPDPMIWMTITITSAQGRRKLHLISCYLTNGELNWDKNLTATVVSEKKVVASKYEMDQQK